MNKNNHTEDDALEEALSPIVNRLIDKNYETSQDKISSQMAPLIGSAIREQIKSQKDDVVDALYPVLGNMISRYVTKTLEDMLEKINLQIQNGLSVKSLKRKLTAKIKGVSETELLLNENASANIRALLLIHKETGIVLAHSENPNKPISEPEMLASMMTAIRSFVNDWIEGNSEHQELGEIEYGGNKIIIETSGYSYLAVIVEGSAYKATYDKIRETLENIVLKHGDMIRNFDGDLSKFANVEIYKEVANLLSSHKTEEEVKTKIHPLLFLVPLSFLMWGGFTYYKNLQNRELTFTIEKLLYKTPELTSYNLDVSADDGTVLLKGRVPLVYYKKLAEQVVQRVKGVKKITNALQLSNSFHDPMQISANISYLLRGFNIQNGVNLSYSYDYTLLTIKGSLPNKRLKDKVIHEIDSIKNIQDIHYNIAITPPKLHETVYFNKASTKLTLRTQATLIRAIESIKKLDTKYNVVLTSYSDQIGSIEKNKTLAKKRLLNVSNFLQQQGAITQNISSIIYNTPPEGVKIKSEAYKARCIVISYTKKDDNVSI